MSNPDQSPANPELDEYTRACAFAREKASVAYVQRKMGTIGFMRAIEYMERMISDGVISTYAGRNLERMVATEAAAMAATVPAPAYWARKDGMKAMSDDEKQGWIESGNSDIADDYSIPLYASCQICSGHGVVGHAPDGYYPCPECTSAQAPVAGQPAEPSPTGMTCAEWINTALAELDGVETDDENNCLSAARSALDKALIAAPKGDSNG